jgi:hypothetical protein
MEETDINNIENEIIRFNTINKEINSISSKLTIVENSKEFNQLIIKREKELKNFSSQAIGSVMFYNLLNEKYDLFDEKSKFNKIIRFLEHIENKEKRYRELYIECIKNYTLNPKEIPIYELKKEKNEIDVSYSLLSILANEVNGDVVNFNKVYNNFEDAGLFMTVPEKINQQYLSEISLKLDNVLSGLKVLFESIEETNRSLRDIEQNTNEMSSNMYDVTNHLWDISSNIKDVGSSVNANNILTGIQTYQLYQINKNTKPNKK